MWSPRPRVSAGVCRVGGGERVGVVCACAPHGVAPAAPLEGGERRTGRLGWDVGQVSAGPCVLAVASPKGIQPLGKSLEPGTGSGLGRCPRLGNKHRGC